MDNPAETLNSLKKPLLKDKAFLALLLAVFVVLAASAGLFFLLRKARQQIPGVYEGGTVEINISYRDQTQLSTSWPLSFSDGSSVAGGQDMSKIKDISFHCNSDGNCGEFVLKTENTSNTILYRQRINGSWSAFDNVSSQFDSIGGVAGIKGIASYCTATACGQWAISETVIEPSPSPSPTSTPISGPFDSEDFESDLSQWEVSNPGSNLVELSTERKQQGSRSLKITHNDSSNVVKLVHGFTNPQQGKVEAWFYDDYPANKGSFVILSDDNWPDNPSSAQMVAIGVYPYLYNDTYWYRIGSTNNVDTHIQRSNGWHKVELVVTPKGSYGKLDGINLTYLPSKPDSSFTSSMTNFKKIGIVVANLSPDNWSPFAGYFDSINKFSLPDLPASIVEREQRYIDFLLEQQPVCMVEATPSWAKANRAVVLAVKQQYSEVEPLIREVTNDSSWKQHYGSPLVGYSFGLAAWISWSHLSEDLKNQVKSTIKAEADYWKVQQPNSRYQGDTTAEENAWNASILALASQMFPNEANANEWEQKGKVFAYHAFTIGESYGGVYTQTLFPDYSYMEHSYHPHPGYALTSIGLLGEGAFVYLKTGKIIPDEYKHNIVPVWNAVQSNFDYSSYQFKNCDLATKFGGKDDWGSDITKHNLGITYYSIVSENNSLIDNLTSFEHYVKDFNAFPKKGGVQPVWWDPEAIYFTQSYAGQYYINTVTTLRHTLSSLLLDPNFALLSTSQICNANIDTRCNGNTPQICNADGTGWETSDNQTVCGSGKECSGGSCVVVVASPSINPACQYDYTGDDTIDFNDLLDALSKWGIVGINGFLGVLSGWGVGCG